MSIYKSVIYNINIINVSCHSFLVSFAQLMQLCTFAVFCPGFYALKCSVMCASVFAMFLWAVHEY